MKLTQADIKSMDPIGSSPKGEVFHLVTKGGHNMIVMRSPGGEHTVIGSGPHRSFALHQAEMINKNIKWHESLFKSEDMQKRVTESNPQNHYDLASHHSKMAGKHFAALKEIKKVLGDTHDANLKTLYHSDVALKNYGMAGLNSKESEREHKKHMNLHHEIHEQSQPPFHHEELESAWQAKNPTQKPIQGLHSKWGE